jgi:hypothetical protein
MKTVSVNGAKAFLSVSVLAIKINIEQKLKKKLVWILCVPDSGGDDGGGGTSNHRNTCL